MQLGLLGALRAQGPASGPPVAAGQLPPPPQPSPIVAAEAVPAGKPTAPNVADIRLDGIPEGQLARVMKHVAQNVRTRAGRPFVAEQVEEDVRRLIATRRYVDVDTLYQNTPDGQMIVIFRLVERPTIEYVKYVGNKVRSRVLGKKTGLKEGMAKDPYSVDEARRKLEEFYQEKGYSRAQVTVMEGNDPQDRGVIFLINEGGKQKVWKTEFEGNTIVSDGRLKTLVQSKPGILWIFRGQVNRDEIEEDKNRLSAYYRSLGFFDARIGRRLDYDEAQKWLTVTFVIDEGVQYKVRNVSIVGNTKFAADGLSRDFKLVAGDYFNQAKMNRDVADLQDKYGIHGYVFAAVEATPTFNDEQKGVLDLIYRLDEGQQYRVGRIDPIIKGDHPHTRLSTVLNRVSIRPGDIMDLRELRNSERRLKASGLFVVDPSQGEPPKIVFKQPEMDEGQVAERPQNPNNFRGQSPDPERAEGMISAFSDRVRGATTRSAVMPIHPNALPRQPRPPVRVSPPPPPQIRGPQDRVPLRVDTSRVRGQSPGEHVWGQAPQQPSGQKLVSQRPPVNNAPGGYPTTWRPGNQPVYTAQNAPNGGYAASPYPQSNAAPSTVYQQSAPGAYSSAPNYGVPQTIAPAPGGYPATGPQGYSLPQGGVPTYEGGGPALSGQPAPTGTELYPQGGYGFLGTGDPTQGPSIPTTRELPTLPIVPTVEETQTGRLMFGVGINSNAGVVGNIVIDERNFDIFRVPRSWEEIRNFTAFRGGGQQFRIEAVPGNQLQRYMITFREPYLFDSLVSFGLSGFLFTRQYFGWNEDRIGGRVSFGYQFPHRPDLSVNLALGGQNVEVKNPRFPSPPQVIDVLGDNALYTARLSLMHDTRDSAFLATEGHMFEISYEQAFGDFTYPRGSIEGKQYFHTMERADGSGRHVLSFSGQVSASGDETPVFENFYAGGFSTIRGFDFRGASPRMFNVPTGGRFMLLGSVEYMVPLTPDDMLRAVVFCDAGTVEEDIDVNKDNFRVAPGFGLRITVPALGPAPIALDLAAPIAHAGGDDIQNFSFFVGYSR